LTIILDENHVPIFEVYFIDLTDPYFHYLQFGDTLYLILLAIRITINHYKELQLVNAQLVITIYKCKPDFHLIQIIRILNKFQLII